jgi:tetratricopeptide (TPR) repeat protein
VKVDDALRILPDVEAVSPMRSVLLSIARLAGGGWDSGAPYLTIGRRHIAPDELRRHIALLLPRVRDHLASLWDGYVTALECLEANRAADAVASLLANGQAEQGAGRPAQARKWFEAACTVAAAIPERRPELDALLARGQQLLYLGFYEDSARDYQRALALAESEFAHEAAVSAAKGLGDVAVERGAWAGARAWYARAARLADTAHNPVWTARVHHARAELARRAGDTASAREALHMAREIAERAADAHEMARILATQGMNDAQAGLHARASSALLEALAWSRRAEPDNGLVTFIHMQMARVFLGQRRFLEAEHELRQAEAIAIAGAQVRRLAQVYSTFGDLRGRQGDETGFVFFEQALALSRSLERWPIVEAHVLHEYAHFKQTFGYAEEAAAYLEQARRIFTELGATADVELVQMEMRAAHP